MRLTAFTDYRLPVQIRLAGMLAQSFTTARTAFEFEASRNHLDKVVQNLRESGHLETYRGAGSSFRLAIKSIT